MDEEEGHKIFVWEERAELHNIPIGQCSHFKDWCNAVIIEDTLAAQGWIELMSLRVQQQHGYSIVCKRLTHFTNLIPVRLLCRKAGVRNVDKLRHFSNPYCTLS
jgi:hypothetical protein